jgi:NADPH2:quinone reductase
LQQIFGWIKEGRVRPHVTKRYPLEETAARIERHG